MIRDTMDEASQLSVRRAGSKQVTGPQSLRSVLNFEDKLINIKI